MSNDNKPDDKTQDLMKSSKAAKFLGVPHRTFKFWVKAGKLIPDFVSEKGYNFFSEENLARFKAKAGNEIRQTGQNGTKAGNKTEQNAQTGQCQNEPTQLVKLGSQGSPLIYVVDPIPITTTNAIANGYKKKSRPNVPAALRPLASSIPF